MTDQNEIKPRTRSGNLFVTGGSLTLLLFILLIVGKNENFFSSPKFFMTVYNMIQAYGLL